jgi:hypothetical protein
MRNWPYVHTNATWKKFHSRRNEMQVTTVVVGEPIPFHTFSCYSNTLVIKLFFLFKL